MRSERAADDEPTRPPASLARAIRQSIPAYIDEIVVFLLVNIGIVAAFVAFALVRAVVPALLLLAPLLALPVAVLMRLAVVAAREGTPSLGIAAHELGRYVGRKLLLAGVQLLVLAVGVTNLFLASSMEGFVGVLSGIVAGYAVVATSVYAVALWPIVCDPAREAPLVQQLRLALAASVLRPLQVGVLVLIAGLSVVVSVQLIAPAIFLPSLVLLAIAGYVVPLVDRLRPTES